MFMPPFCSLIASLNTSSAYMLNNNGDSIHPCRTPHLISADSESSFSTLTSAVWDQYNSTMMHIPILWYHSY
ncbi:hypothetical protein PGB90_007789 [Kerria lacca]